MKESLYINQRNCVNIHARRGEKDKVKEFVDEVLIKKYGKY